MSEATYGQPSDFAPGEDPDERPATVTAAGILTIIITIFTEMLLALAMYGLLSDRDGFIDALSEARDLRGMEPDDVFNVLVIILVVLMVWTLVAFVLAILTMRRSNVARLTLVVSSVVAALLSLLTILTIAPIVIMICASSVVVMLTSRSAKTWFEKR